MLANLALENAKHSIAMIDEKLQAACIQYQTAFDYS